MMADYIHRKDVHNLKAPSIVVPIVNRFMSPGSIVDVGCGIGTWLKVFKEKFGVEKICGVDGIFLDTDMLMISEGEFFRHDLRQPLYLNDKYDLCISLEVGEHLPEESSKVYVESLCRHSDFILFSAAVPGQGGQNHINEQWPSYWDELFFDLGYCKLDPFRSAIWSESRVDLWYRQNIYLYVNKSKTDKIKTPSKPPTAIIHPGYWQIKVDEITNLKKELNDLRGGKISTIVGIKIFLKSILNKLKSKS